MLIRHFTEIMLSSLAHHDEGWSSYEFLNAQDNKGVSLHEIWLHADTTARFSAEPHTRVLYCIEGEGEITQGNAESHVNLRAGTLCVLDVLHEYQVQANVKMRFICFVTPPVSTSSLLTPGSVVSASDEAKASDEATGIDIKSDQHKTTGK